MAEGGIRGSKDLFSCSVCLEILSDPVSIPCGHNFCMKCITSCWDSTDVYSCPQCRETFTSKPDLRRNTLLDEVVKSVNSTKLFLPQRYAGSVDVECDFCTEKKLRAVKSCLTCLVSFCETHMQPHFEIAALKKHKLINASKNLQQKLCAQHEKTVEVFCKLDQTCICLLCMLAEHKGHESVELETERAEKQTQMSTTLTEIQQRVAERNKKVEEMQKAVKRIKNCEETEITETEKSFGDLICTIEETQKKVTESIRKQAKREVERAEGIIEQLEEEIEELRRRHAELTDLSGTDDHIYFLQTFPSVCIPLQDDVLPDITVSTDFRSEELMEELFRLNEGMEKISKWEGKPVIANPSCIQGLSESWNKDDFMKYHCQLTLDPISAHTNLCLSEENTAVTWEKDKQIYLHSPHQFDSCYQILSKEGLSGNRFYWEVEWSHTVEIGVTYKGIGRKGDNDECCLGCNDKSWSLFCCSTHTSAWHDNEETELNAEAGKTIGVYLDWPAGILSFYDISDTMTLLHSFKANFTEPLYPAFRLWVYSPTIKICAPE
ncbi:tripartite motif-containing protein 16-like [Polypterus senegalus]|uniref:tripartite motif-containing protein 16-like n=1 Tax=Polypterus senegalus TaxID=55291 RepID=UPI0019669158|nr:tripartite motif-containing protein 16-like [Polypterus senegalus]